MLDSASYYIGRDELKSVDFLISALDRPDEIDLATKTSILSQLGNRYAALGQHDLAVENYTSSLSLRSSPLTKFKLAQSHVEMGDFQSALPILEKLVKGPASSLEKARSFLLLGSTLLRTGDTPAAISNLKQGLALSKTDPVLLSRINQKLGQAYESEGSLKQAESYYTESILSDGLTGLQRNTNIAATADFYSRNQQYGKEIELRNQITDSRVATEEINLNDRESIVEDELALEEKSLQPVEADISEPIINSMASSPQGYLAAANPNSYLSDSNKDSLQNFKARQQLKLAKAYDAVRDNSSAERKYLESYQAAVEISDLDVMADAASSLASYYENRSNNTEALKFKNLYVVHLEQLINIREAAERNNRRRSEELLRKQNRIYSLEKDRQLRQNRLELALSRSALIEENNTRQRYLIIGLGILTVLLMGLAAAMWRNAKAQRRANMLLELRSLRGQMNPHFIFNALNSVNHHIAVSDERAANRYLSKFSKLMRSVLEINELELIPLSREIELLSVYMELEHERFSDRFEYDLQVADDLDLDSWQIPPMLVQPLVENAVWHGLRYRETMGQLTVNFQKDQHLLKIVVVDNGVGREKSEKLKTPHQQSKKSTGLRSTKNRIELLNSLGDVHIDLVVADATPDGNYTGTEATLTLKRTT